MPFQRGHKGFRTKESYKLAGIKIAKNPNSQRTQFKKGIIPWSKNQKGIHLSKKSEFKKGDKRLLGKNNPNWKGGITPKIMKARDSEEYIRWRLKVFKKDNFTCQDCGDNRGGNLHAHHIKLFSLFPKLRYIIKNGLTLCKKCHIKIHKKT